MSHLACGIQRPHDPTSHLVFVRGAGSRVWDAQGKDYLDFTGGYSACNFGHAHPQLVKAAQEQIGQLAFITGGSSPWRDELAQLLTEIAPVPKPAKVYLATTGARAVEIAWKIAHARKPGRLVHWDRAFHGRSLATSLITDTRKLRIASTDSQSIPYPDCHRCPIQLTRDSCGAKCMDNIFQELEKVADHISAIVIEPLPGARGYLMASSELNGRVASFAKRHGILLISDEIQTALGRLGGMFGSTEQGWSPDLVILGKSLGGGLVPISAVVGDAESMDRLENGIESETFSGNPLACRIACEAIRLLQDGSYFARGKVLGVQLRVLLCDALQASVHPFLVEGMGAFAAVEFHPHNITTGERVAWEIASDLSREGILCQRSGPWGNRLVFLPPLVMTNDEFEMARSRIRKAFQKVAAPS